MTPALIFRLCSSLALLGWLLLILAGFFNSAAAKHRVLSTSQFLLPGFFAVIYLAIIVTHWAGHQGGFGSVADVQKLFANPWLLVAGWIHYLAFDLFLGSWQVRDAQRSDLPHWSVVPSLILTFLFGPIGFLLYLLIRSLRSRIA